MNYRFNYLRKVFYKSFIKIIEVDKDLYLFQIRKLYLIDDDLYFNRIYS